MGQGCCCSGPPCPETVISFEDGEVILFDVLANPPNTVEDDVVITHWRVSGGNLILPTNEQGTYTWLVPLEPKSRYSLSVTATLTLDETDSDDGGVAIWNGSDPFLLGYTNTGTVFVRLPGETANTPIGTLDTVSGPITVSLSLREYTGDFVRLTASVGAVQYSVLIEDMVLSTDSDTWPMGVFLDNNAVNTSGFSQVTVSACGPSGSSSSSSSSGGSGSGGTVITCGGIDYVLPDAWEVVVPGDTTDGCCPDYVGTFRLAFDKVVVSENGGCSFFWAGGPEVNFCDPKISCDPGCIVAGTHSMGVGFFPSQTPALLRLTLGPDALYERDDVGGMTNLMSGFTLPYSNGSIWCNTSPPSTTGITPA